MDFEALPHRFAGRTPVATARTAHEALEAGATSGVTYRLAGRVLARRGQGKVVFCDLEDRSGRIQLMGSVDAMDASPFAALGDVSIGDVVGVDGELIRSRRGELTLRLTGYVLLAPCPDFTPMRISTGFSGLAFSCRVAAYLNECAGTTRSSWSAVVISVAGYLMPGLMLWSGE